MPGAIYPSLKNRTVLVTDGGSGIGEAIVRQFVLQGSRVGFVDIDVKASKQLLASLPSHASVHFEPADLRDIGALRRAVAGVREALGPITILINNAARDDRHAIEDVTPEYWDERIAVNLKHQFFSAQAVAPEMIAAGGGSIINIGSVSWVRSGQHAVLHHRKVRGSGLDTRARPRSWAKERPRQFYPARMDHDPAAARAVVDA